jgi:hypothetical protein
MRLLCWIGADISKKKKRPSNSNFANHIENVPSANAVLKKSGGNMATDGFAFRNGWPNITPAL